jgi:starch synthase
MPPPVKFLGVKPRGELVELYQQASVVAVPSVWDNSPNVIYEAMACGTPVVASRVGGIPELVDDGVTGLLVPPGDADALADAIVALLGDPARRAQMGEHARERAVEEYSVDKIVTRTVGFYEYMLDSQ